MELFNSLSRKVETFVPITEGKVGMYTCGPTVYSFITIGNWRTYFLGDMLVRTLKYLGYEVDYVMNITDVGHLTGDNLGDASTGDDRLEKAAQKEGKSALEIASFYTEDFYKGFADLKLTPPKQWCKATDHIAEQVEMIGKIVSAGFGYTINDGVYFDTKAFEAAGNTYGELSTLESIKEGARVEPNPDKKDPRDFALWKFSYPGGREFNPEVDDAASRRQMEWESPWGLGFPGWHIECSAMSQKYLGEQFDIHVGGEDLKSTHHPNEIAQAEAATGKKPFVRYWVHGAFLLVDGGRMGKSLGNAYRLADLEERGFSAMDLRYFYMTGHYRKQLNFTFDGLASAAKALATLKTMVVKLKQNEAERTVLSSEKLNKIDDFRERFLSALETDLNMPEVLAVVWELVKSNVPSKDKYELLLEFDQVLGFGIGEWEEQAIEISEEVRNLVEQRKQARMVKDFGEADRLRQMIANLGYEVEDVSAEESVVKRRT